MFSRYASAVSSSVFVTFALLFLMQLLITLQPGARTEPRTKMNLRWVIPVTPDTPIRPIEEIIPRDDLTKTVAEPPRVPYTGGEETLHVPRTKPVPPTGTRLPSFGEFTDGPLVVMVRVAPVYPARAIAREIEGYVVVQFDVTTNGHVANAVVIESTDSLFDKAAIRAAEKFKFKPRIVDGVAFESYGIQNLFRFSLDEQ